MEQKHPDWLKSDSKNSKTSVSTRVSSLKLDLKNRVIPNIRQYLNTPLARENKHEMELEEEQETASKNMDNLKKANFKTGTNAGYVSAFNYQGLGWLTFNNQGVYSTEQNEEKIYPKLDAKTLHKWITEKMTKNKKAKNEDEATKMLSSRNKDYNAQLQDVVTTSVMHAETRAIFLAQILNVAPAEDNTTQLPYARPVIEHQGKQSQRDQNCMFCSLYHRWSGFAYKPHEDKIMSWRIPTPALKREAIYVTELGTYFPDDTYSAFKDWKDYIANNFTASSGLNDDIEPHEKEMTNQHIINALVGV
ncbi:hypothetical protein KCM76_05615 [Zooshikella marina]|uniref:hypothetical protein n=1 Tax=Zooshikella ganghwensis TaxID=202772 RepID=UPI001BB059CF|nr:hypothetical protein [Zooshikella ganghwensis]MBU2705446.1 hypothetical protein [Zooshikella ganghwensis]